MILKSDVGFSTKVCNGLLEIDRISCAEFDTVYPDMGVRPIVMSDFDQGNSSGIELVGSPEASVFLFENSEFESIP